MTRFPEPGRTKTRLIPVLGAEQAAKLHTALVKHTLAALRRLSTTHEVRVEIHFAGGDPGKMAALFGMDRHYVRQTEGHLGDRISAAVGAAFDNGAQRVVVIGTDCPDLSSSHLQEALEQLDRSDLVVGPAADGGYYLLAMRQHQPELFRGIDWGTENVLKQTLAKADSSGLSVQQLAELSDVDVAEDLIACRRHSAAFEHVFPCAAVPRISVIIPALNEQAVIGNTLACLRSIDSVEILVVDGGSTDRTRAIAETEGVRVLECRGGRAKQMNAGAALAAGDVLLFLHADTRLPPNFVRQVREVLATTEAAGAFRLRIEDRGWLLRIVERGADLRSWLLGLPYGDQAIFVRASTFYQVNGFRPWPLLEDYDFCRRIRQRGRVVLAESAVVTSGRRWRRLGVVRTTLINQLCLLAWHLGISPQRIAVWYRSGLRKRKLDNHANMPDT